MTVEEFEKSLREKGLSQKRYDDSRYKDDAVMVVEKVRTYEGEISQIVNDYRKEKCFYGIPKTSSINLKCVQEVEHMDFLILAA